MVIKICLFCSKQKINGVKKGHKEIFECECGAKYKALWAGDSLFSLSALHKGSHFYHLDNRVSENIISVLLDTDKIVSYN